MRRRYRCPRRSATRAREAREARGKPARVLLVRVRSDEEEQGHEDRRGGARVGDVARRARAHPRRRGRALPRRPARDRRPSPVLPAPRPFRRRRRGPRRGRDRGRQRPRRRRRVVRPRRLRLLPHRGSGAGRPRARGPRKTLPRLQRLRHAAGRALRRRLHGSGARPRGAGRDAGRGRARRRPGAALARRARRGRAGAVARGRA